MKFSEKNFHWLHGKPQKEFIDPRQQLENYILRKIEEIEKYKAKPNPSQVYIDKAMNDLDSLRRIHENLELLPPLESWFTIGKYLQQHKDLEVDGIIFVIPYVADSKPERMIKIDLSQI